MFSLARTAFARPARAFSTSTRAQDMARLTLIGRLAKEPEVRTTKTEKEYVAYTIVTKKYGHEAQEDVPTFHRILSFHASQNAYLLKMQKGSLVHVEAEYEMREGDRNAEPGSYANQRQIFLRHENIRLLTRPKPPANASETSEDHSSEESHR
ncbi:hypothetical protein FRB94_012575 [Tulasnella sp. JGI-2019a]|nr:hypothetical protein FRB93_001462 [Tulasnella sp. JGI-2019a]KAG9009051.1 hypothetical protein FRB94_012575 [Tulasnella sp. JGI-2019a]KAG9030460.1 hypothetical protein FRB95_003909 [Tulasnella sp. JGI-2019a]